MSQKSAKKEREAKYKFSGKNSTVSRKANAVNILKDSLMNVAFMCKQLGIRRRSYERWRQLDPEFNQACLDINEEILDQAEVFLQKKITEGDTASLIFFLKTKAKQRGYIEKREVEHSGSMIAPVINLVEKSVEEIKHERKRDSSDNKPEAKGNAASPGG